MNCTLFLGAGASMPLGFPDTKEFKASLEKSLTQGSDKNMLSMLHLSECDDIENVLTAIDALANLNSDKGFKLLQNIINATYVLMENDPNSKPKSFDDIVAMFSEYKKKIQRHIYKEYSWENRANDSLELYDNVFKILRSSDDGIHICTTNYDQVMEHYIDSDGNGLARVDGFVRDDGASKLFFDPNSFSNSLQRGNQNTKRCYLYKLHGSLNWVSHKERIRQRETDESIDGENNLVIYPTLSSKENDYNREPYKTMLSKFKERVEKTRLFIVIGYSFRDKLINDEFKKFLRRKYTMMFVVSPSADLDTANGLGKKFDQVSLEPSDPSHMDAIQQYRESPNTSHGGTTISGSSKLKTIQPKRLPAFSPSYKVYNLVCTLEVANNLDLLRILLDAWPR